jgi:CheY-like chemotaxis protein
MLKAKNILLVDDDSDDRELFLEAVGEIDPAIRCSTAENGEKALQLLRLMEPLPDFIFLDLNMPCVDGRECLARIKMADRLRNIPVVIYSTSASPKDIIDTRELGAFCFSTKPASYRGLKKVIEDILFGRSIPAPVVF